MAGNAGGSYEDLSTLEDVVPGEPMGTSGLMALHKLENLRIDKLKQMRKPSATKVLNLPAIPGAGEIVVPSHPDVGPVPWALCQERSGLQPERFPHLSFTSGGPPHVGCAPSLDSMVLKVFSNLNVSK